MSATDCRISTTLPHHPKTKRLIRRLGHAGAWHLIVLFVWTAANRPDGNLSGLNAEDIEIAVDWMGDPGAFVSALVEVGFLKGDELSYLIHDWAEHNPWAAGANERSAKASAAARARYQKQTSAAPSSEPDATSSKNPATRSVEHKEPLLLAASSTAPFLSSPNQKQKQPEPATAEPGPPVSRKAGGKATTIATWVAACEASGVECIPADDPIFRWAADAGIPLDFLALAWSVFVERHTESGKRQADWRATFRNAVRGNWYRLWWMDGQGTCSLTTVGQQVKRAGVAA